MYITRARSQLSNLLLHIQDKTVINLHQMINRSRLVIKSFAQLVQTNETVPTDVGTGVPTISTCSSGGQIRAAFRAAPESKNPLNLFMDPAFPTNDTL